MQCITVFSVQPFSGLNGWMAFATGAVKFELFSARTWDKNIGMSLPSSFTHNIHVSTNVARGQPLVCLFRQAFVV